jgi:hypothetical protein
MARQGHITLREAMRVSSQIEDEGPGSELYFPPSLLHEASAMSHVVRSPSEPQDPETQAEDLGSSTHNIERRT